MAALLSSTCREALVAGESRTVDLEMPGGVFAQASVTPVVGLEGQVASLTVVIRDLTGRRNAELARTRLEAQLHQSQKMEALGQLTGGVAHDFNNLLTVIHGNLELLGEKNASVDREKAIADGLMAVRSAATLTRQLLAFSRKQPLQPRRLAPLELLRQMKSLLRRTLGERFELVVSGPDDQWDCEADADQLRSAVVNLVINARDAMPDGGRIVIETSNAEVGREPHDGVEPGLYVRIAVSDPGVGIAEENLEKVFEPFFTTKGVGQGSGLGLSMVYGFVRQSRGGVRLSSEPGAGTTLELYLPRATNASVDDSDRPSGEATARGGKGRVVLVVEDDDAVRSVVVRMLQSLDCVPIDCRDAEEAIEVMRSAPRIDLLLTDVVLAGDLDGLRLAVEAKRLRPELAVLYMSGYTRDARIQTEAVKAAGRLDKPFTRAQLARALERLLPA